MKITSLKIINFKAFENLELDADFFKNEKYLFVGKNGSGKTSILEAMRLCVALGQEQNQQSIYNYGCLRDTSKSAEIEAVLELDDEELKLCQDYLTQLNSEDSTSWSVQEKDRYDQTVAKEIVSRVKIHPLMNQTQASLDRTNTYLSQPTTVLDENGQHQSPKFHIVYRMINQDGQRVKPLVYIMPFRGVNFQETALFSNYQAIPQVQNQNGAMVVSDPINNAGSGQQDFGKNYFQFSYSADLYSGVLGEFYRIAKEDKSVQEKVKEHVAKQMVHVNEMIAPKAIYDVKMDTNNNTLTYAIKAPEGEYTIYGLSAGEEQLVIFGLSLPKYLQVSKAEIKPIIIVDEPELHLHPEYCKRLGRFLGRHLPIGQNRQLFMASHSVEIIQELADSAYEISSTTLKPIENVKERTALFHNLGANFSVADIVRKVVFVEGVDSKNVISDNKLYQKLSGDPYSRKVRFVGVGDKKNVQRVQLNAKYWRDFVKAELDSLEGDEVFAILDGDILDWVNNKELNTDEMMTIPCYSVENLLLTPSLVAKAFPKLKRADIDKAFKKIKKNLVDHTCNKLEGQFKAETRRAYELKLSRNDKDAELRAFGMHFDSMQTELSELPTKYRNKINGKKNWYYRVDGKKLGTELMKELKVSGGAGTRNYDKLIQVVTLSDIPLSLRKWLKEKIIIEN